MRQYFAILLLLLITVHRYLENSLTLPWAGLFILFSSAVITTKIREKERVSFINQLKSQRSALRKGGTVVVDNMLLRYNSTLYTYHCCIAGLVCTASVPSNFLQEEEHKSSLLYSFVSLLSGWWAIPDGPIKTVNFLQKNLSGGEKITVAELIDKELFKQNEKLLKAEEEYLKDKGKNNHETYENNKTHKRKNPTKFVKSRHKL